MADLIAIGYPDETTAIAAEEEAQRLANDLIIQPDAIAAIVRTKDGKFKVTTNHHAVAGGASYGMFWGLLFGLLFFIPFFGMAIGGWMSGWIYDLTGSYAAAFLNGIAWNLLNILAIGLLFWKARRSAAAMA